MVYISIARKHSPDTLESITRSAEF